MVFAMDFTIRWMKIAIESVRNYQTSVKNSLLHKIIYFLVNILNWGKKAH